MADSLDLGSLLVHLKAETSEFNEGFENASSLADKVFSFLSKNAELTSVAVVASFVAMGAAATKAWSDLDAATLKTSQQMGNASDTMREVMETNARQLATQGNTSVDELTSAYGNLAQAGYSAAQSVQALSVVNKSADATGQSLASTISQLTGVQKSFGLVAKDSTQNAKNLADISDTLIAATQMSNVSFSQLAAGLDGRTGTALKTYGVSLKDAVGMMAALAESGIPVETSGRQMISVFEAFNDAATKNNKVLQDLGISITDAAGNLLPMDKVLQILNTDMGGMDQTQKRFILNQLGIQGQTALVAQSLIESANQAKAYGSALDDVSGKTDQMASKIEDTLGAQFAQIWNNIKEIVLQVGEAIAPVVKALLDSLSSLIGPSQEWNAVWKEFIQDIGPALITVIGLIGDAWNGWKMIFKILQTENAAWIAALLTAMDSAVHLIQTALNGLLTFIVGQVNTAIGWLNKILPTSKQISAISWKPDIELPGADTLDNWAKGYQSALQQDLSDLDKLASQPSFSDTLQKNYDKATQKVVDDNKTIATSVKTLPNQTAAPIKTIADQVGSITKGFETAIETAKQLTDKMSFGPSQIGQGLENPFSDQLYSLTPPSLNSANVQTQYDENAKGLTNLTANYKKALDDLNKSDIAGTQAAADAKAKIQKDYYNQAGQFVAQNTGMIVQSAGSLVDQLTQITGELAGKNSTAYKAMFAVSKAFAIADSTVSMFGAIAKAADSPFPSNLVAMATVAADVASIISSIQSVELTFGGGKASGGDVKAGSYYQINENGQELFAPGMNGKIIPNDMLGGKGTNVTVNVQNYTDANASVQKTKDSNNNDVYNVIIKKVKDSLASDIQNGTGQVNRALTSSFGLQRGKTA